MKIRRVAMWSGPRNVSTALMRSFGARTDTFVSDEPLYAAYLKSTGKAHPMAEEIVKRHESDWKRVVHRLTESDPEGKSVWYQKHMSHHLLPEYGRDWLEKLSHAFLIREPRSMLASLASKLSHVQLEDTGLPQQVELFRALQESEGKSPPVIDSKELLLDPRGVLEQLCGRLEIPFEANMLRWESGPRDTDGCWGVHWYANTEASTGFAPHAARDVHLDPALDELARVCEELHAELAEHRILARNELS